MKKSLNFLSILGVVAVSLRYYMADRIGGGVATACMVTAAILLALNSPLWYFVKAALSVLSFGFLLTGPGDVMPLVRPLATALLALLGIFVMVRKVFGGGPNDEEHFVYNRKTRKLRRKGDWW